MMRSLTELADLAAGVVEGLPTGWAADVRVSGERWGTMRFATSRIHQPHLESSEHLSLRAVHDHCIGIATTSDASPDGVRHLVRDAMALARVAPPDPQFPAFPSDGGRARRTAFSAATSRLSPAAQIRLAEQALDGAREVVPDARISGVVNVGHERLAFLNTSGLARTGERSAVQGSVLVERPDLDPPRSGWDEGAHWDVAGFDAAALGRSAARTVPTEPIQSAKPGTYSVVLGGAAAAELFGLLGHLGFNARGDEQGWGCLARRRGKRVAPTFVQVDDDGPSARSIPRSVDYEGMAKRRQTLLDQGVAGPPVTDLRSAARLGTPPTGHGPPPESPFGEWGPVPTQVVVAPGDASPAELLQEVGRGLFVTRFHYVRVVDPARSIITGMTRDGTYRIENGRLGAPVRNVRFTESVLGALGRAQLLGRATRRYSDERGYGTVTTPAFVTDRFRFTSATLF
jgi:PmbA protein